MLYTVASGEAPSNVCEAPSNVSHRLNIVLQCFRITFHLLCVCLLATDRSSCYQQTTGPPLQFLKDENPKEERLCIALGAGNLIDTFLEILKEHNDFFCLQITLEKASTKHLGTAPENSPCQWHSSCLSR